MRYSNLRYVSGQIESDLIDLELDHIFSHWRPVEEDYFQATNYGNIENELLINGFLWGIVPWSGYHNPQTFSVNYLNDGFFSFNVNRVRGNGSNPLNVYVDDILIQSIDFIAGDVVGKVSVYDAYSNLWTTTYVQEVRVEVLQGAHEIKVENVGTYWIEVKSYKFEDYAYPLRILGLSDEKSAYIWIQNKRNSFLNARVRGNPVIPVPESIVDIHELAVGNYNIQFFNTTNNNLISKATATSDGSTLTLSIPSVETDIAGVILMSN